jgi:hypothetical protein
MAVTKAAEFLGPTSHEIVAETASPGAVEPVRLRRFPTWRTLTP